MFSNSIIAQPTGLLAKPSPLHGLGVFAAKSFEKEEVIEKAPVILLTANDKELLACTRLYLYYFVVDNPHTPAALGLGLSSLYNHSPAANARYRISVKNEYLEIIACRSVSPGEEITLNYNGDPNDPSPVYFPGINMGHQLYIKNIKGKGRGVFCREPILQDEVIEICQLIVLPADDYDTAVSSRLADYFFNFVKEERTLTLVLGFGSLYNHAIHSNAAYQLDRESRTMIYYALESIPAGKEISINYSGEQGVTYTEWFESRNIRFREK